MIYDDVLPQLDALTLDPGRPLLVVDVDEVIVGLAGHLGEYAASRGYSLELTGYKLDGALKRSDGQIASADEFRCFFKGFFETETVRQRAYPGAADVLNRLSRHAQIVILTNVPPPARACRIENLRNHGIEFPLIVNQGGKGGALDWMARRIEAPAAFIDDSPKQIESAAKLSPHVARIHFVGDAELREMLSSVEGAEYSPKSWCEIEKIVTILFSV